DDQQRRSPPLVELVEIEQRARLSPSCPSPISKNAARMPAERQRAKLLAAGMVEPQNVAIHLAICGNIRVGFRRLAERRVSGRWRRCISRHRNDWSPLALLFRCACTAPNRTKRVSRHKD